VAGHFILELRIELRGMNHFLCHLLSLFDQLFHLPPSSGIRFLNQSYLTPLRTCAKFH
jgi:hypothetical protein